MGVGVRVGKSMGGGGTCAADFGAAAGCCAVSRTSCGRELFLHRKAKPSTSCPHASCASLLAGIPSHPPVAPKPLLLTAEYIVNARKTGHLQDLAFLDKWKTAPGVIYAKPCVQPGAQVGRH